jgi:phosphate starvation-inducible PhoH-like protein
MNTSKSFFTRPYHITRPYHTTRQILKGKKSNNDLKSLSHFYKPRTPNQEEYVKYLSDPLIPIVLGIGPAGSGKTLFACNQAVMALKKQTVDKIILTRPVVSVEEDIGFLPGSMINKMDPWTRPLFDFLLEFYAQKDIDGMLHSGVLEISPLGYMRGRTFKDAFIIADEMQNSSPNQMLMLTTRIGENSKMVITGDLKQSDRGPDNGLADLMRKLENYNDFCLSKNEPIPNIKMVRMQGEDIQRSPIVSTLLEIYSDKPREIKHNNNETKVEETKIKKLPVCEIINDAALIPLSDQPRHGL